ncbi:MAG: hypothetical protein BWY76_02126 [bacterium ADurb.Bin429]|nr:MAG: hypothetical protein BWY76_02126 [bacterium ADurb.Bin429]
MAVAITVNKMPPMSTTPQAIRRLERCCVGIFPIMPMKNGTVIANPTHAARAWVNSNAGSITNTAPSSATRRFGQVVASAAPTPSGMSIAR